MKKQTAIAFLGALVPDTPEYRSIALRRSGNMVQDGLVCGLKARGAEVEIFSAQPRPSYPRDRKIFYRGRKIDYRGMKMHLVPFFNILVIKTICIILCETGAIIAWALRNRGKQRILLVYNTFTPPLAIVWLLGKITRSRSAALLYDQGMPPRELHLSPLKRFIYRLVEINAKFFIPRIDRRIVINEAVGRDYGGGKDFLVVDGGISHNILDRLFELETPPQTQNRPMTFLLAGLISPINGTRLLGEALAIARDPRIRVVVAGNGHDLPYIEELCAREPERVSYAGSLNLDELFELYARTDVLLNLRVLSEADKYLFPSKFLEYLTVGKPTVTTPAGHIEREYGAYCFVMKDCTAQTLAQTFDQLLETPTGELSDRGRKARKFMVENRTWESRSAEILDYLIRP